MQSKNGQIETRVIPRARQARRPSVGLRLVNAKSQQATAGEQAGHPPRSPEPPSNPTGVTRFNALRHGVLSRYTVLPWEDEDQYSALLEALVAEHKPQGPTEEHMVEEVVGILWRKRRLRLAEGAICRRAIKTAPSNETIDAALSHLSLSNQVPGDDAKQLADLARDQASLASSLELLRTGKARSYEKALGNLNKATRERWDEVTRSPTLLDFSRPAFSPNANGLLQFLEKRVQPGHEAQRKELENQPLIREQVLGESFQPDLLDGLAHYEVHLDRKLERMLSMLIRLRDLRRPLQQDQNKSV